MSEMSYARQLLKGNRVDRAHMRQAENEHCYGEHPPGTLVKGCRALGHLLDDLGFGWQCGKPWEELGHRDEPSLLQTL